MHDKTDLYKKISPPYESTIRIMLLISATVAIIISAAIIYTLASGTLNFINNSNVNILEFFFGTKWIPNGKTPSFGVLPLICGTALVAGGALLFGGPLGLATALYLSEFASKKVKFIAKPIIEILAGIPSVVYGFFALMVISPLFREIFGASYFNAASAIVVMSIMVLPLIVSISDDSLRAVPTHLREASLALGATKWETASKVVLPAASSGVIASILLALGRALGETMVVTMAAGSIARLSLNPFGEVQTMTAYIAQIATGDIPPGVAVDAAYAVGLLLFALTYLVNIFAAKIVDSIKVTNNVNRKKNIYTKIQKIIPTIRFNNKPTLRYRQKIGKIWIYMMGFCLVLAFAFLTSLILSILSQGLNGLSWTFLTSYPSSRPHLAGIYPVILGSVYLVLLTLAFSVPVGVGAAIYLTEIAHDGKYTKFLRRIIQNLAGVPSIVFGLVGLTIFVRIMGFGMSLLSGSLTLAIMVLPIIVVSTEEALKSVPQTIRHASLGLGATKWQGIRDHVLPSALPGILTGTILALSRAIGETAPILFIGSIFSKTAPNGLLDGFLALPLTIFFWTRHPKSDYHMYAASTILVMLVILLALNSFAIIIREKSQSKRKW